MTAPMQITASTRPDCASARAANGISNDPGTDATTRSSGVTPRAASPRRTPSSSRSTIGAFQRDRTSPMRSPLPSRPAGTPARACSPATRPPPGRNHPDCLQHGPMAGRRLQDVVEALEQVAHALALGAQVGDVLGVGRGEQRNAFGDLEAEALEAAVLRWVVCHQPHGGDAQVDEDLRPDAVLAAVDREAEGEVGVDGVVALVLQLVGPQLVAEADAAALVASQ